MRKDVFISYSSLDKKTVHKLATDLRTKGVAVWLDEWEIAPGANIVKKINEGLHKSSQLLVVVSENSLRSHWVEEEWTKKFGEEVSKGEISVIPVVLGLVKEEAIPLVLRGKRRIDLSKNYKRQIDDLAAHIHKRRKEAFSKDFACPPEIFEQMTDAVLASMSDKNGQKHIADQILARLKSATSFDEKQKVKLVIQEIAYHEKFAMDQVRSLAKSQDTEPEILTKMCLSAAETFKTQVDHLRDKLLFITQRNDNDSEVLASLIFELEFVSRIDPSATETHRR